MRDSPAWTCETRARAGETSLGVGAATLMLLVLVYQFA